MPKKPNILTGTLTVSEMGTVEINITTKPIAIVINFTDEPSHNHPCNHHHHHNDKIVFEVVKRHLYKKNYMWDSERFYRYFLVLRWEVADTREVEWVAEF